jgi:magnesium chelatase subunit I
VPRVSDLGAVIASTAGKVELESVGEDVPEERVVERLITKALYTTFGRRMDADDLDEIVDAFDAGLVLETGDRIPSREYVRWMREIPGLPEAVRRLGVDPAAGEPTTGPLVASAVEFILEGLHLQRRLNKDRAPGGVIYRR